MESSVCTLQKERSCCSGSIGEVKADKNRAVGFEPITKEFILENRDVLYSSAIRLCDLTPGCLYMWRDYYNMRAAIVSGMLVCIAGDHEANSASADGGIYYTYPVGNGDLDAALKAIRSDAASRGRRFRMCTVPDEAISHIEEVFLMKAVVDPNIDRPDFLYHYENFLGYAGKALHAHRNHINRFMREVGSYSFEPLTIENRGAAAAFLREHHAELEKESESSGEDLIRTEELLNCFEFLRLTGGILYADGRAVGFTMGEAIGDTLHVHVEKADHNVHGAFQMLAMKYAEYMRSPELKYINRQDDAEDEGLYRSKMSYRPCALLNKNVLDFE